MRGYEETLGIHIASIFIVLLLLGVIHIHISCSVTSAVRITHSAMQKVKSSDGLGFYSSPKGQQSRLRLPGRGLVISHTIMSRVPLVSLGHKCQLSVNRQNSTLEEVDDKPKSGSCGRTRSRPSCSRVPICLQNRRTDNLYLKAEKRVDSEASLLRSGQKTGRNTGHRDRA